MNPAPDIERPPASERPLSARPATGERLAIGAAHPPEARASAMLRQVTFVGALPPPVTGKTLLTAAVVAALEARTKVHRFNWSRGKPLMGWRWRVARTWGALKTIVGLLAGGRAHGASLYYGVSDGAGLYYDLAIVGVARMLGYRAVLHHHTYGYIVKRDWRVALLNRLAGQGAAHVVHCQLMKDDFLATYDSRGEFLMAPPTIVAPAVESDERLPHRGFTIGFLSYLSIAKGLDDVLRAFEQVASQRSEVQLSIAGPFAGKVERQLVEAAVARWPNQVTYLGPIYGAEKTRFFADIDAFLFPTRNESWGIVLSEALAASCPIIARTRGCIPWIVQHGCGLATPPHGDFVEPAVALLMAWIDSPELHAEARANALRRSRELHEDARRQLPAFVEAVVSATPS